MQMHRRFYQLNGIDGRNYSSIALKREEKLKFYDELLESSCKPKAALRVLRISKATYYRWKNRYKIYGLAGLEKESKRPKNLRKPCWKKENEKIVLKARKQFPLWGKYKIQAILKREFGVNLSVSTVGRIIVKLMKQGKIKPVVFYLRGQTKIKKRRIFNKHAKRWNRTMRAKVPGELVQLDHMTVHLGSGETIKHFEAICSVTKISFKRAYKSATSIVAANFLEHAKSYFPFKVKSVQVDGGSEFMGEFEDSCKKMSIDLYVIPPRSPKYNGHVERANGTSKYEFYWQYTGPSILETLNQCLKRFVEHCNTFRPHQSLQYKTPMQYYQQLVAS